MILRSGSPSGACQPPACLFRFQPGQRAQGAREGCPHGVITDVDAKADAAAPVPLGAGLVPQLRHRPLWLPRGGTEHQRVCRVCGLDAASGRRRDSGCSLSIGFQSRFPWGGGGETAPAWGCPAAASSLALIYLLRAWGLAGPRARSRNTAAFLLPCSYPWYLLITGSVLLSQGFLGAKKNTVARRLDRKGQGASECRCHLKSCRITFNLQNSRARLRGPYHRQEGPGRGGDRSRVPAWLEPGELRAISSTAHWAQDIAAGRAGLLGVATGRAGGLSHALWETELEAFDPGRYVPLNLPRL